MAKQTNFQASLRGIILALLFCAALPAWAAPPLVMPTNDPNPGRTPLGTFLSAYLNPALQSIATCNPGSGPPANGGGGSSFPGECWVNTSANPWVFSYTPDGVHWAVFGKLTTDTFIWTAYSQGIPVLSTEPTLAPGQVLGNNGTSAAPAAPVNYLSIGNGGTTGITDQFGNYLFSIGGLPAQANGGATNGTILSFSSHICSIGDEDFAVTGTPTTGEQPGFTYTVGATTATVTYTVQVGDSNASIAAGIVAAAKANAQFQSIANGTCPNGEYYNGVATFVQFGSSASGGFDPIYTADPNGAGNSWTAINTTHTTVTVTPVSTYTGNIEENYVVGVAGRHSVVGDNIKTNTTTYPDNTGANQVFFQEVDQAHNVSTPSIERQWLTGGCDYTWLISSGIAFFGSVNGCSLDIVANGLSTSNIGLSSGSAGNITLSPGTGGIVLNGAVKLPNAVSFYFEKASGAPDVSMQESAGNNLTFALGTAGSAYQFQDSAGSNLLAMIDGGSLAGDVIKDGSTVDATSLITGAFQVSGGASVAKQLRWGTTATAPDGGTWGTGGINGSNIGATTPGTGKFTSLALNIPLTAANGGAACGANLVPVGNGTSSVPSCETVPLAAGGTGYTAAPARSSRSLAAGSLSDIVSTSYQQLGFKGSITPATSGNIKVTFTGEWFAGALSDICFGQISYGTGTAPNNGTSAAGSVGGIPVRSTMPSNGGYSPFSFSSYLTGLTVGTPYWLDLQIKDSTTSCQVGALMADAEEQ
jgi:hypothetical protein